MATCDFSQTLNCQSHLMWPFIYLFIFLFDMMITGLNSATERLGSDVSAYFLIEILTRSVVT